LKKNKNKNKNEKSLMMTHTRLVGELVFEWMIFILFLPWTWAPPWKWVQATFPYLIGPRWGFILKKPFVGDFVGRILDMERTMWYHLLELVTCLDRHKCHNGFVKGKMMMCAQMVCLLSNLLGVVPSSFSHTITQNK
jgi:hypothetical protein